MRRKSVSGRTKLAYIMPLEFEKFVLGSGMCSYLIIPEDPKRRAEFATSLAEARVKARMMGLEPHLTH